MHSDETIHLLFEKGVETVDRDMPGLRDDPHKRFAVVFRFVDAMLKHGAYAKDGQLMAASTATALRITGAC